MTLYEMTEQAKALYELLQNEEIDEQTLNDTLEAIGADEKLDVYCKLIRQYETDADAISVEIDRLTKRKKTAENAVKRLKNGIQEFMEARNITKADIGLFKASIRESKAVQITDERLIPGKYLIAQPVKIDKAGISKALKSGESVAGAELITNKGVVIK